MIKISDKSKCSGCYSCVNACPKNCISMESDSEGFLYPKVDKDLCIDCNICEKVCPIINKVEVQNEPVAYAAYNKDEKIRLESSSGGIFSLIAESIINQNGIVFGACFDEDFNVMHDYADNIGDLSKFRGSKYVQSKIGNTYKKTKEFLDDKRLVLFTGTPCQIGGLKAYLQKDYPNLICQDLVCHGVPSPKVWQKYVKFREKCVGSSTQSITFRHKNDGWRRFSVSFLFKNGTEYCEYHQDDLMMKAFLRDICLRPSCHNCSFKGQNRTSDITLADFWGIQNLMPDMDDDKGTSLILINTSKGKTLFNSIKSNIIYRDSDINKAIHYNLALIRSSLKNDKRDVFMKNIDKYDFNILVKKYCSRKIYARIKNRISIALSKIKSLF